MLLSGASLQSHVESLEIGRTVHVARIPSGDDTTRATMTATTLTDVSVNAARGGKTVLSATLTSNG
ncbi:hypothetical protein ACYOEI_37035, partial [Singulisphaera rosea]